MKEKIILLGAGGHCQVIIDSILGSNKYEIVGIVDRPQSVGKNVLGVPIVGSDLDLQSIYDSGINNAFIAIGSIGNPKKRIELYQTINKIGFRLPNIIDETAIIAHNVKMGFGNYLGKRTIVNIGTKIGNMCIINSGAIVEHENTISDFAHIAPGATLCGNVYIGTKTHVGSGSVIIQGIKIGHDCLIGAGSTVIRNIPDEVKAYGVPAKIRE